MWQIELPVEAQLRDTIIYISWKNKLLFNYFLSLINNSELILAGKKITSGLAKIQRGYATRVP